MITDPAELAYVDPHRRWPGLKSVAKVCYRRGVHPQAPQQALREAPREAETRYYTRIPTVRLGHGIGCWPGTVRTGHADQRA